MAEGENDEEDPYVSVAEQNELRRIKEHVKDLKSKGLELIPENNEDFYFFYQCSTGENLFLHNFNLKMVHATYDRDFKKYPLQIKAKVVSTDFEVLDKDHYHYTH